RPVLEKRGLPAPGEVFEKLTPIVAEPGEERQVVGARDHIDRVELDHADALDGLHNLAAADLAGRPRAEALGGDRDPPRFRGRELTCRAHRWVSSGRVR